MMKNYIKIAIAYFLGGIAFVTRAIVNIGNVELEPLSITLSAIGGFCLIIAGICWIYICKLQHDIENVDKVSQLKY